MLPLFDGPETSKRRQINLGGASTSSSAQSTLESAKARRNERIEHKRRVDAAVHVQAWWRGCCERRRVREVLLGETDSQLGVFNEGTVRRVCFVGVGGGGKDVLGRWSRAVVARKDGLGDLNDYLRRTLTRTLLNLVASGVNSEYCADHLALLTALKSPPPPNFYQLISKSLRETTKTSVSLPALITLLFSVPPNQRDLLIHILTIPLLPNRLPLQTLTALSSSLPLSQLGMNDVQGLATQLTMEDKVHLLSNLLAFTTPRYPKLPKKALSAYLNLIADLLDPFPPNAFDPEAAAAAAKSTIQDDEDDIQVRVVESFDAPPLPPPTLALPKIDAKTLKRIQGLVAPSHITSLMSATATATATSTEARSHLFRVVLGMIRVWPAKKESVVAGLWGGGGIVKDLWRGWVRSSGLGREVGDPSSSSSPYDVLVPQTGSQPKSRLVPQTLGAQQQDPWPALLLLCEIYTQVLGTMGDDEFFGAGTDGASSFSAAAPLTSTAIRNPLSLDDLRLLSRMVLNVVWVMYTSPPPPPPPLPTSTSTPTPTPTPTPLSSPNAWHETRVTLTTLLRALHARDARRAYVPEGHWIKLAGDDGGWDSFVEAALVEEERVLADTEEDPDRMDVDSEPSSYPYGGGGGGGGGGYGAGGVRVEYIGGDEGAGLGFDLDYPPPPRGGRYHHPHPRAQNQNQNSIRAKRAKERLAKHQRILEDIPFAVPFELRVRVFRGYVALDQVIRRGSSSSSSFRSSSSSSSYVTQALATLTHPHLSMHNARYPGHARNRVEIRRTHISQDGFDKLGSEEIDFKDPIEIIFKDQWGQEEAGIDGGGLFKEFFTSLSKEVFDPQRGLWVETGGGGGGIGGGGGGVGGREEEGGGRELYPRAGKYQEERYSLEWYRFVGRVVGKALYDGILVDVVFARFFLARWLALGTGSSSGGGAGVSGGGGGAGRMTLLDDLRSLDEEVWRGLVFLKHLNPVGGEVEALGLRFCVDVEEFGQTTTHDLIPHGSLIPVTPQNRLQYISLLAHFKLIKQIRLQSHAFFSGVAQVIPARWVRMFTPSELSHLLGGSAGDVDVEDLRRHTKYGGLYVDGDGEGGDQRVRWFWEVVRGFSERERRGLLRFVTSCSRGPLLGFKELNPQFAIRDAGEDQDRLPTASTCVNLLKLPRYASRAVMRAKLLQAINSGAGFDLS